MLILTCFSSIFLISQKDTFSVKGFFSGFLAPISCLILIFLNFASSNLNLILYTTGMESWESLQIIDKYLISLASNRTKQGF